MATKKYTRWASVAVIVLCVVGTAVVLKLIQKRYATTIPAAIPVQPTITKPTPPPTFTPNLEPQIPATKLLNVPFTPQAPTANWDELHNEACEEASIIMAYAYFSGIKDTLLKPEFVEQEITKLTEWQQATLGYNLDITAEETARMAKEVYGLSTSLLKNFTENDIKKEIAQGNLILLPAQGQQLGNPYFKHPGPPYHMIVLHGFNSQGFITNDPGTKRGANYTYTFNVLYSANGNWEHQAQSVNTKDKIAVVISAK